MSGIRIVSTTPNGERAIRQNLEEHSKASLKERILFRQAYRMSYEENPMTLIIMGKHRYLTFEVMEPIATDMMSANGAGPDDYVLEAIE